MTIIEIQKCRELLPELLLELPGVKLFELCNTFRISLKFVEFG